jgi:hypothetical protein
MGIVNAVLLTSSKVAPRWVTDASSIAAWGRLEGTLAVGDVDDPALIDEIGAEWLSVRSQPMLSHVYVTADTPGQGAGVDYREGDTLTDPALRVVEIDFSHADDGRFVGKPTLSTKLQEAARRNEARIERLIAEGGGASPVSESVADTGSGIEAGKLGARQLASWTWTTEDDLYALTTDDPDDEETWQAYVVDEPVRLTEMILECNHLDGDGFPVATGPTRFRLMINGAAVVGPGPSFYDVVVGSTEDRDSVSIFGTTFVRKGDRVAVRKISAGDHVNGSVQINASEVV